MTGAIRASLYISLQMLAAPLFIDRDDCIVPVEQALGEDLQGKSSQMYLIPSFTVPTITLWALFGFKSNSWLNRIASEGDKL